MYIIKVGDFTVLPMAFNIFYNSVRAERKKIKYSPEYQLSLPFFDDIKDFIENEDNVVAIDMERITYSNKIFSEFMQIEKTVIFFNIDNLTLRQKMDEDMDSLVQWNEDGTHCILNVQLGEHYDIDQIRSFDKVEYQRIVEAVSDREKGKSYYLESAGIYSNVYVNVKKLFLYPQESYFVLFGIAKKILNCFEEFDAFISSSKNGAILANLLGALFNKKVVHIDGIGPQYSMRNGSVEQEIKKKRRYLYVFDFICTGMEMKLLATLIKSNMAYLIGGIGIAQYKNSHVKDVFLNDMKSLIIMGETNLNYKIAGTEEDIQILMACERKEEENDNK